MFYRYVLNLAAANPKLLKIGRAVLFFLGFGIFLELANLFVSRFINNVPATVPDKKPVGEHDIHELYPALSHPRVRVPKSPKQGKCWADYETERQTKSKAAEAQK